MCASLLDIKERSNKDGKKYAFLTMSEINSQYELSIFSENLSKFRHFLKEGSLLIFEIDIVLNNNEPRYIIRTVKDFNTEFNNMDKKINIFLPSKILLDYKDHLLIKEKPTNSKVSIFININNKLVNLNMNNKYALKSYKQLDLLKKSKKLDYNIDIT